MKCVWSKWCNALVGYVCEILEIFLVETLLHKKKEKGFNYKEIPLKSHYGYWMFFVLHWKHWKVYQAQIYVYIKYVCIYIVCMYIYSMYVYI